MRRASFLLVLLLRASAATASPAPPADVGDLDRAWYRVNQQLEPLNRESLLSTVAELQRAAEELSLERLTPAALALVVRSRTAPHDEALVLLREANRLDPKSPEVLFSLATEYARGGAVGKAVVAALRGVPALLGDGRLTPFLGGSLLVALAVGGLAVVTLWAVFMVRRTLPVLWHDLVELGERLRLGSNQIALALAVVALPLLLAGDPVWLLLWLFALCWAYFSPKSKGLGVAALLLVAAAPTLLEIGLRREAHPASPVLQAAKALQERRWSPHAVEGLATLGDVFGSDPEYHRLLGDCYRQLGRLDAAAWAYREGLRLDPANGELSLASGTVHFLEGDFNAALEAFKRARESGADPIITDYDLSLTLAHTYHFRESTEVMQAAQRAANGRLQELLRGREDELIMPFVSLPEARRLLARASPVLLLKRGILPPPLALDRTLEHPLTIAAIAALFLALVHFLVRERKGSFARACLKCGRAFCARCKFSQESQGYCSQCVNIFLKRDMVQVEAQLVKRRQVDRRNSFLAFERRLADLVLPGLGLSLSGRTVIGPLLIAAAWISAVIGGLWLPWFVQPLLLQTSVWPLLVACAAVLAAALVAAQALPARRR